MINHQARQTHDENNLPRFFAASQKPVCVLSYSAGPVTTCNLLCQQFQPLEGRSCHRRAGGRKAGTHGASPALDPRTGAVLVRIHTADFPIKDQGRVATSDQDPPWWLILLPYLPLMDRAARGSPRAGWGREVTEEGRKEGLCFCAATKNKLSVQPPQERH